MDNIMSEFPNDHEKGINKHRCSQWQWRDRPARVFAVLVITLVLVTLIAIIFASLLIASQLKDKQEICTSSVCIQAAARILESIDDTVHPCDDFFEYACGSWNRQHPIPDDASKYDMFSKLHDDLQAKLRALLEEPVQEDDIAAIRHTKDQYQACVNLSAIEDAGNEPMLRLLLSLGGWPVLHASWKEQAFDLETLLAQLRLLNSRVLIYSSVSVDDRNSSLSIIKLDQAFLALPNREYYLSSRHDNALLAYERMAMDVAMLLGANEEQAVTDIRNMLDFEIKLANITTPAKARRDSKIQPQIFKISELYTNITDRFDWLKYMKVMFAKVDTDIEMTEEVALNSINYMKDLFELLEVTPNRTLANYLLWRVVMSQLARMPSPFIGIMTDFNQALTGANRGQPRWRSCVSFINDYFGMALARLFVNKKYFDETSKVSALEMISYIEHAFKQQLEEVPWMDDDTRAMATEKLNAIKEQIGYPDYILNDTVLNEEFEHIQSHPERYFDNSVSNARAFALFNLKLLRRPEATKDKWFNSPVVVNAFYYTIKNQIIFPAGILQPPFYHKDFPMALNFGGIAVVVGHEITHGFDDNGRHYDKQGNLKPWWTEQAADRFRTEAQCFVDQYSNYTEPTVDMKLDGALTLGENIADNGAIKQAFRAYRNWITRRGGEEPQIVGLNMTNNQLFFVSFAQLWCGTTRPEFTRQHIMSDYHTLFKYRVLGSLSNSVDFANAFSCPIGSNMNPARKCSMW